ncbi:MAG TPA: hypothetical protein VGC80_03320, partial [Acetobacteraceae bacterium]
MAEEAASDPAGDRQTVPISDGKGQRQRYRWRGLAFLPSAIPGFQQIASPYQPIHDSRAGVAVLYRYEPRPFLNQADWPEILLHDSAARKMTSKAEGYTPVMLRNDARVLGKARHAQLDDWSTNSPQAGGRQLELDADVLARAHDRVWRRQVYYVLMVISFSLLILSPWLVDPLLAYDYLELPWLQWFRPILRGLVVVLGLVLPGWLTPWREFLGNHPAEFVLLAGFAFLFYQRNRRMRECIAEFANLAWSRSQREQAAQGQSGRRARAVVRGSDRRREAQKARLPAAPSLAGSGGASRFNFVRWIRNSPVLREIGRTMAGAVLPGIVILVFMFILFMAVSRTMVAWQAPSLCEGSSAPLSPGPAGLAKSGFAASDRCWASGIRLARGERYRVSIYYDQGLFDGPLMAPPAGFGSSVFKLATMPFARWWSARWLQPIARIADPGGHGGDFPLPLRHEAEIPPRVVRTWHPALVGGDFWHGLDPGCTAIALSVRAAAFANWKAAGRKEADGTSEDGVPPPSFTAEFTAAFSGELFLYLNDATVWIPTVGLSSCAYDNNAGVARV